MPRPRRDWRRVNIKFNLEYQRCRICLKTPAQRAHVIGRIHDDRVVHPDDIIPLCEHHHNLYDEKKLDIAPYLQQAEIERAIALVGHGQAARRIRSSRTPAPLPGQN